jgi:hypothetical protein
MSKQKSKRGGARPGAGAPLKNDTPVKPSSISLTDAQFTALDEMAEAKCVKRGELIRDILVRSIKSWQRKRDA